MWLIVYLMDSRIRDKSVIDEHMGGFETGGIRDGRGWPSILSSTFGDGPDSRHVTRFASSSAGRGSGFLNG